MASHAVMLPDFLQRHARDAPGRVAFRDAARALSYADAVRVVDRLAQRFVDAGIVPCLLYTSDAADE